MSRGLYIWQRNELWEAKICEGGDFINSAFTEIEGYAAVREVIQEYLGDSTSEGIQGMVRLCAEFVTERESWVLDGRFRVDVDTNDFGYLVEVELTRHIQNTAGEHNGEPVEEAKSIKDEMDGDIQAFMLSYPQAFRAGRAQGKSSTYFDKLGVMKSRSST